MGAGKPGAGKPGAGIGGVPDIQSTAANEVEEEWEEDYEESGLLPFSIVVILLSVAVFVIEFLSYDLGQG